MQHTRYKHTQITWDMIYDFCTYKKYRKMLKNVYIYINKNSSCCMNKPHVSNMQSFAKNRFSMYMSRHHLWHKILACIGKSPTDMMQCNPTAADWSIGPSTSPYSQNNLANFFDISTLSSEECCWLSMLQMAWESQAELKLYRYIIYINSTIYCRYL